MRAARRALRPGITMNRPRSSWATISRHASSIGSVPATSFSARVAGCMVVAYCSTIGVRISGGQITDTPIPSGAHSSRSTRARPITPALDAA